MDAHADRNIYYIYSAVRAFSPACGTELTNMSYLPFYPQQPVGSWYATGMPSSSAQAQSIPVDPQVFLLLRSLHLIADSCTLSIFY